MAKYERGVLDRFAAALGTVPHCAVDGVDYEVAIADRRADAVVHARFADRPMTLLFEVKKQGFPRDVRQAVWQLRALIDAYAGPEPVFPVVAVETLSPGAKALLQEENVGYFDGDGNLFVPADSAFIYIDKPPSKQAVRQIEAVFVGKRARVTHAVWLRADAWFGVHDIAEQAEVSPATASETLKELENREWVRSRGAGPAKMRQMIDPAAMLDAWADRQREAPRPSMERYYVSAPDVEWMSDRLHQACTQADATYEITGQVAGQAYAPYLTQISKLHCRIAASGRDEALAELKARPVQDGWNLGVLEISDAENLAFRQMDETTGRPRWLADPLQTYLDLLREGGRSDELAKHLRDEWLGV